MLRVFSGIFAFLCIAQLLGIAGSAIAATVDIESIVAAGPIFSIVGLAAAVGCLVSRSPANEALLRRRQDAKDRFPGN